MGNERCCCCWCCACLRVNIILFTPSARVNNVQELESVHHQLHHHRISNRTEHWHFGLNKAASKRERERESWHKGGGGGCGNVGRIVGCGWRFLWITIWQAANKRAEFERVASWRKNVKFNLFHSPSTLVACRQLLVCICAHNLPGAHVHETSTEGIFAPSHNGTLLYRAELTQACVHDRTHSPNTNHTKLLL